MTRYEVELTDEQARAYERAWPINPVAEAHRETPGLYAARALAAAIRANPPKPPRMDEPGPWAVVEAHTDSASRRLWVNHEGVWIADGSPLREASWHEFINPSLVRAGDPS